MCKTVAEKVLAYITRESELLVFSCPHHPEAGIQVPGGTVKAGESPEQAVIREAREETGLQALAMRTFLGVRDLDLSPYGRAQVQRRYFFHLECLEQTPTTWRHFETDPSDGSVGPIALQFYWVRFPEKVPELSGGQGVLLGELSNLEPRCEGE